MSGIQEQNQSDATTRSNKKNEKKETSDNYLLLGVPRSGKTTYFCTMAEHLQKLATSSGRFGFKFCDNNTSRFIDNQMKFLRNNGWPEKTPKKDVDYKFQLVHDLRIFGVKLYTEYIDILYHDYPGEAFNDAFSDAPSGMFTKNVEDLKEKIATAQGIFLMLDAKEIFNEENVESSQETLVALIKYLQEKAKRKIKLALIFNKIELIPDYSHREYLRKFKLLYRNAYQWLHGVNHQFFSVYTVGGECRVNEHGNVIPPEKLNPRSVLKPVNWMIRFI